LSVETSQRASASRLAGEPGDNCGRNDGTAAGTSELAVAGASSAGLQPSDFSVLGNVALFAGHDATDYVSLWSTDGTAAGTHRVDVAGAGAFGLTPSGLATITITPPNPLRLTLATGTKVANGQSVSIATLSGFAPGDTLSISLISDARIATGSALSIGADGLIRYTPGLITAASVGADAIRFVARDLTTGDSLSGTAQVGLSNGPAPGVVAAGPLTPVRAGAPTWIATATPGYGQDPLAVTLLRDSAFATGSALALGANGQWLYTPGAITSANAGRDTLSYTVTDTITGAATTRTQVVTLVAGGAASTAHPLAELWAMARAG
jgi:ELWxxDGT repeat protein